MANEVINKALKAFEQISNTFAQGKAAALKAGVEHMLYSAQKMNSYNTIERSLEIITQVFTEIGLEPKVPAFEQRAIEVNNSNTAAPIT